MLQAASSCGALPLSRPLPQRAQRAAPKKCHPASQGQVVGCAAPRRLQHASCAVPAGVVRRKWAARVGVSSSLSFRASLGSTCPSTARPAPARRAGAARWTAPPVSVAGPQPSGRSDATVPSAAATLAAPLSEPLLPAPPVDLSAPLPQHPLLLRGQLPNGLRYVVLPNRVPPNRFEAHLEMHAGSVDEGESEQGVAHFVEHVTFLGSRKREKLLGTGARSNAYTDFHHTVFHVHAPTSTSEGVAMLPQVLEALVDIAFAPLFADSRVEKERRAVLAEAQMMNTIEYRVDCQLLTHLHWENALGCRFPIGLSDQIQAWTTAQLRAFHSRWYFPANATLYVVGDVDGGGEAAVAAIEAAFGGVAAPADPVEGAARQRQRHRPPVRHAYGSPAWLSGASALARVGALPGDGMQVEATPRLFQHALLQQFSLSLFSKLPVVRVRSLAELRRCFAQRVVLSVLQFRASRRAAQPGCAFVSVELDHSDSAREGCAVSTLTITSEAEHWAEAVRAACAETRSLARRGVTAAELQRYSAALMRDSEQLANQSGTVPSLDNLDFVMESDALGHTVMDQVQGHSALAAVAHTVSLDEVNDAAAELLSYISEYGRPLESRDSRGGLATAIVACVPATVQDGTVPFTVSCEEIAQVLAEQGGDEDASRDVAVPDHLVSPDDISALVQRTRPCYVLLDGSAAPPGWTPPAADCGSGIAQRRLSNGVRVNWRVSLNEPAGASLRLVAPGGRAAEMRGAGSSGTGAVALGARALTEAGAVGAWEREQVELFCVTRLVTCQLETDEEFLSLDAHCAVGDGGLRSALEVIHLMLSQPRWEPAALERAKALYTTHVRALPKSLERATAARLMQAMLAGDRRFMDPDETELAQLSLDGCRDAVAAQLACGELELNVVGDFDADELDELVLRYIGTVTPPLPAAPPPPPPPVCPAGLPADAALRAQRLHLEDSDERACAYCAGPAPNRWGWAAASPAAAAAASSASGSAAMDGPDGGAAVVMEISQRRSHPLFHAATQALLQEVVNSRLFTTVRDALGLTYDVSFELSSFDRLKAGWFLLSVTSTPSKVDEALAASLRTLRGLASSRVTSRELERARKTLLTRHESDLKDNAYVLGLLTHTQSSTVPLKTAHALADVHLMYSAATVDDLYVAFAGLQLGATDVFTCVGTSGTIPEVTPPGQFPTPAELEAALAALAGADVLKEMQARYRLAQQQGSED